MKNTLIKVNKLELKAIKKTKQLINNICGVRKWVK